MNVYKKNYRTNAGFTLVEVMVAVGIFAIVVTIGLAALLSINVSYTNSRAQQLAMDQMNFAMETMSREIRVGYNYFCSNNRTVSYDTPNGSSHDCRGNGGNTFAFFTSDDEKGLFFLNDDGRIEARLKGTDTYFLTPDPETTSIEIEDLRFRLVGTNPTDDAQPIVLITLTGKSQVRQQEATFTFQTLITQRVPDLQR